MKFVILVKATKASEAGTMPSEEGLAGVLAYNQELVRAGVMLDGVGLSPTSEGFRIRFSAEGRTVIDGPFDDENLVAGYWLIEVASRDEAMRWAMKIPNTAAEGEYGEIEVRRVFELDEFEQGPVIEGFRELEEMESIAKAVDESDSNGHRLRVRIGLHTGEPIREADDFYGKAVIQAARIAAEARGSEILVSSLVRDLTESSGEYVFATPRDVELKGLSGTHRVAPVLWQDD